MVDRDFERLYTEKFTPIYKYVYFRVRNYDVATDITQDVFLKVFEKEIRLDQETELRFLYTIARNKVIDYFRKKKTISIPEDFQKEDMSIPRPDDHVVQASDIETVFRLLDQLSEGDREIIIMRYLQELDYKEISEIVKKEESALRQVVSRGIKKLKEIYEQDYEQEK